jgi:putative pyruvate formate lyase activating enzyme
MICELVRKGATNINLVSPTPYTTYLVPVLQEVKSQGIGIPIVWNSNCYESVETLKLLEGLVDIYLPDFKYWDDECSATYSGVRNYREIAQESLKEMIRQTGHLLVDEDGLAFFGTMIRLLVLPSGVSHIKEILHWLHDTFGSATHISLMSQYYPAYKACEFAEINRGVTKEEYAVALKAMEELGFENGFVQEPATTPEWTPTF